MGIGCSHCRVIGGPHDDGCPEHPSAVAARETAEEESLLFAANEVRALIARLSLDVEQGGLAHGTDEHKLWLRERLMEIEREVLK